MSLHDPGPAPRVLPIEATDVGRTFGEKVALDGVSLQVGSGSIHALLGPNGAGKTTLLRILTGLVEPDRGVVRMMGIPWSRADTRQLQRRFGFVPSGDRTFYLRLSGLENLAFFARMYGLSKRAAIERSREVLAAVELEESAAIPMGQYSHGMQKRLSLARALLLNPPILFVDEATHDLDPEASTRARSLITDAAAAGAAVVWTTQRVDEIRGFADRVTLLDRGTVRFEGTVPELMGTAESRRFLIQVDREPGGGSVADRVVDAVGSRASVLPSGGSDREAEHLLLVLQPDAILGDVIAMIAAVGVKVVACREERSEIEQAFLRLTGAGST